MVRKTRLCCYLIFLSKSPGGHAIYRRNARMLEIQNFSSAHGWTYDVRMYERISQNQNLLEWIVYITKISLIPKVLFSANQVHFHF